MTVKVDLKTLLESGAHFGHQTRRWDPKMAEYLHGEQDGVHIFDLTKTKEMLDEALLNLTSLVSEGKTVLFVGTKKQAKEKVKEVAEAVGMPYVNERWLGGTLTNFEQILRSIKKLEEMKKAREEGVYNKYTKKERVLLDREITRLERFFSGVRNLKVAPDALFVVDIKKEKGAVHEASRAGKEIFAVVDSNCDPFQVDYVIPMNDDASKAVEYVLDLAKEAVEEGKKKTPKPKKTQENAKN